MHASLRAALRALRRRPGAAQVAAALALTLGLGVSFALFAFLDALMAPALRGPYAEHLPRLVRVHGVNSWRAYEYLRDQARTLDLGVYWRVHEAEADFGEWGSSPDVLLECVSPDYLDLFGARPLIGQAFRAGGSGAGESGAGGAPSVLLAHHAWTRYFANDGAAIGALVRINGRAYTVTGVMPPAFGGAEAPPADAWTLLAGSPEQCLSRFADLQRWRESYVNTIGRLREPFALAAARDEATTHGDALEERNAALVRGVDPVTLLYDPARPAPAVMRWASASAAVVALLACVNFGLLLLFGVVQRRLELAVRKQVGARPLSVFGQLLAEAVLLGAICAGPAVLVVVWTTDILGSSYTRPVESLLTPGALAGIAGVVTVAGVLSGLVAAAVGARTPVELVRVGDTGGVTRGQSRALTALLASQVALALVLAVLTGAFVRSAAALTQGTGLDLDRVIVATLAYDTDDATRREAFEAARARVEGLPMVRGAALSSSIPFWSQMYTSVRGPTGDWSTAAVTWVSPGYFEATGTRIVRGRPFPPREAGGGRGTVVVSEGQAARLWPEGDALGSCLLVGHQEAACDTVIGISAQRRAVSLTRTDDYDEVFLPLPATTTQTEADAWLDPPEALLVRTHAPSRETVGAVARAVQRPAGGADRTQPPFRVRRLADLAGQQTAELRFAAALCAVFGAIAVLLAGVGVWGATAAALRQRMPEMGLRMALGARPRDVAWLLARRAAIALVAGAVLGGGVAAAGAPLLEATVANVTARDWPSFAIAVVAVTVAVALGAGIAVVGGRVRERGAPRRR